MTGPRADASAPDPPARERILEAACHLFAARGFDGATTKAIAAQAGVPSGLIFYHFGTKAGLLGALMEEESLLPDARDAVTGPDASDPRRVLATLGRQFLDSARDTRDGPLARILLRELHIHPPVAREFERLSEELLELVARQFDRLYDSEERARVASRAYVFSIVFAGVFRPPADPDRFLAETLDLLCPGETSGD